MKNQHEQKFQFGSRQKLLFHCNKLYVGCFFLWWSQSLFIIPNFNPHPFLFNAF